MELSLVFMMVAVITEIYAAELNGAIRVVVDYGAIKQCLSELSPNQKCAGKIKLFL